MCECLYGNAIRRAGSKTSAYPEDDIRYLIETVSNPRTFYTSTVDNEAESFGLRNLRDRAMILILADTGLRAEEVCKLRCGDVNWETKRIALRVNANQKDIVRFSTRSLDVTKEYLGLRQASDLESGQSLSSLPLFARHDKGAGKKVKPITTTTGRNIIAERVEQILGKESVGKITPHSFRHYFVTTVLRGSGNLKLAQELARHKTFK